MRKARLLALLLVLALAISALVACKGDAPSDTCTEHIDLNDDGKCEFCGSDIPTPCETHIDANVNGSCDECGETYETITVAEALELCGDSGNVTEQRYYVRATVKTISNAAFGAMIITDDTGEISVYGTYGHDGVNTFPELDA